MDFNKTLKELREELTRLEEAILAMERLQVAKGTGRRGRALRSG